jgi:hypothetical protein
MVISLWGKQAQTQEDYYGCTQRIVRKHIHQRGPNRRRHNSGVILAPGGLEIGHAVLRSKEEKACGREGHHGNGGPEAR